MERWDVKPFEDRHDVPGKILDRAKIPRRFWTTNLDFMVESDSKKKYIAYLTDLNSRLKAGTGLLLHGPYGTGKTACASLVLIEVLARSSNRALFVQSSQIDWLARHREDDSWDLLVGAPFVVIDDIGAERQVDWNNAWFEEVVRGRYNDQLPTIMTTNITPAALYEKFGWLEGVVKDSFEQIELTEKYR
jgi:DNA replication protein DnaC